MSPRAVQQMNAGLAQLQNPVHLLYQQLLSGAATQSQLLQGVAAAQSPLLQTPAVSQPQQPPPPPPPPQAFALANAAQALIAAQGQLTINQLILQHNPQQQQVCQLFINGFFL